MARARKTGMAKPRDGAELSAAQPEHGTALRGRSLLETATRI
jgi:hypothetical protein